MSVWKKLVIAVTTGCLAVSGVSVVGTSVAAAALPEHKPFKVLSYNVKYNSNADLADGIPTWKVRRPQVKALIESNNPDVFSIFETEYSNGATDGHRVVQNMPQDLIDDFGAEYGYYRGSSGRVGVVNNAPKLIFYRKSRFRLATASDVNSCTSKEAPTVLLSSSAVCGAVPVPNAYTPNFMVGTANCGSGGEDRNVAFAKLQDIQSSRKYFVAAMHPQNHPNCWRGRAENLKVLRDTIEKRATGMSVLAMGDMNVDTDCRSGNRACYNLDINAAGKSVISRIEEGGTGYKLFRSDRHSAPTTSANTTVNTNFYGNLGSNASIDYIFHSGGDMAMSDARVDRGAYGAKDATGHLMSPSDHYAISAIVGPRPVFAFGSTLDTRAPGADPGTKVYFTRVNADACADKVMWNPTLNGGATTIALSKCDGTFAPPVKDNVPSESLIGQFYFADINGDSCADKIYWNRVVDSGNTRVFLSNCNGTFKAAVSNPNTASVSTFAHYYFAKVNADACEDLIYWNRVVDSGRTRVGLSNCNGTFKNVVSDTGRGSSTSATAAFFFADVTGDGLADKIAWDPAARQGHTRIYKSAGNGTFPFLSERASGGSVNPRTQFFFADVTGDKKADELAWRADLGQGAIQIFLGKGTRFSNGPTTDVSGNSEADDTVFSFADINGDGASDKVYWNPRMNGGATRVYLSVRRAD
jgi:endonuclease/exonuclease/phosphatase family metal-dependent hydrolase